MSKIIKEIGNQGARLGKYASKNINAPNYVHWYVIPGAVGCVLSYIIGLFLLPKWNSRLHMREEHHPDCEDCKPIYKNISAKWAYLAYIIVPLFIGLIIATISYKIGFSIKNPKVAAAGVVADFVFNDIF